MLHSFLVKGIHLEQTTALQLRERSDKLNFHRAVIDARVGRCNRRYAF